MRRKKGHEVIDILLKLALFKLMPTRGQEIVIRQFVTLIGPLLECLSFRFEGRDPG